MSQEPDTHEPQFDVLFESLRAAEALAPDLTLARLMEIPQEQRRELEAIDELRRLSEAIAEPELRTYTAS